MGIYILRWANSASSSAPASRPITLLRPFARREARLSEFKSWNGSAKQAIGSWAAVGAAGVSRSTTMPWRAQARARGRKTQDTKQGPGTRRCKGGGAAPVRGAGPSSRLRPPIIGLEGIEILGL